MKKLILATAVIALGTLFLSGCMSASCRRDAQCARASLGQQLLDLKAAQANGAITEAEHQALKTDLISHRAARCCQASVGQQLLDLKTAEANMAITEAEYQTLKADLIRTK